MIGAFVVMDFRDLESWKGARVLVCVDLDLTKSFSKTAQCDTFANARGKGLLKAPDAEQVVDLLNAIRQSLDS
ncbi:MAG TPA: hypothetical protein VGR15_00155 [Bacteroidota bacterium]|jgi:hypothetical protein|nr:hypothetical protein [Bacteroidota bacterium]